jgi:uncharacterized protein
MTAVGAPALQAFLSDPVRPTGTLTYHELQGFLFAVVSAPELISPSEWLPIVFGEQEPVYATLEEANNVLQQIMTLYNDISAAVLEERVALPADCAVEPRALDNLSDTAPLAQWSRGFMTGHDWLEELWEVELPQSLDEELGVVLMTLTFFGSRQLAEAFEAEGMLRTHSMEETAESLLQIFPEALTEYAHVGRSILGQALAKAVQTRTRTARVGRNDPCSCGSGKKFKKCCGGSSLTGPKGSELRTRQSPNLPRFHE